MAVNPKIQDDSWPAEHHLDMVSRRCYGRLIIQYEAGRVTVVRKEETFKPPNGNGKGIT